MIRAVKFRDLCGAGLLALLAFQQPAHAYIDPGTGSLIIQGLIAAFVGAAFALKNFYYTKVKRFVDFVLGRKTASASGEGDTPRDPPSARP